MRWVIQYNVAAHHKLTTSKQRECFRLNQTHNFQASLHQTIHIAHLL